MRAVVDTNVLIRALIKPLGTVGPIIPQLRDGRFVLIYSPPILDELVEKLALPRIRETYQLGETEVDGLVSLVILRGELVVPHLRIRVCRDPDDDMLIEAAIAGNADCIVTGDEDLLTLKRYERVRIVTTRTFLASL